MLAGSEMISLALESALGPADKKKIALLDSGGG
jgi:hypothetical protein